MYLLFVDSFGFDFYELCSHIFCLCGGDKIMVVNDDDNTMQDLAREVLIRSGLGTPGYSTIAALVSHASRTSKTYSEKRHTASIFQITIQHIVLHRSARLVEKGYRQDCSDMR